jgi:hypothetical protein
MCSVDNTLLCGVCCSLVDFRRACQENCVFTLNAEVSSLAVKKNYSSICDNHFVLHGHVGSKIRSCGQERGCVILLP